MTNNLQLTIVNESRGTETNFGVYECAVYVAGPNHMVTRICLINPYCSCSLP